MAIPAPADLITGCYACLTPEQVNVINARLLALIVLNLDPGADVTPAELLSDSTAGCYACLSPKQLQVTQALLLAKIYELGGVGGGGAQQVFRTVAGAPLDIPTTDYAVGYSEAGGMWVWNVTTASWDPFIAE